MSSDTKFVLVATVCAAVLIGGFTLFVRYAEQEQRREVILCMAAYDRAANATDSLGVAKLNRTCALMIGKRGAL